MYLCGPRKQSADQSCKAQLYALRLFILRLPHPHGRGRRIQLGRRRAEARRAMWTGRKRRRAQRRALVHGAAGREGLDDSEGLLCVREHIRVFGTIGGPHPLDAVQPATRVSAIEEEYAQANERNGHDGGDDTANDGSSRGVVCTVAKKRKL